MVVLGVFFGILAANWNLERSAKQETVRLLSQIKPELVAIVANLESIETYYKVSDGYARQAVDGWRGDPSISDTAFVTAAYQASQINGNGINSLVWAQIFGADNLRNIDDLGLRRNLLQLMAFDYNLVNISDAKSRYREEVRKVIPDVQQQAIRARCGDRLRSDGNLVLPVTCDLTLPAAEAARTAAALRARTDLVGELNWHQAGIATQMQNIKNLKGYCTQLMKRIA
ncbi:MAG: hypothetical protein LH465_09950 [Sphingomonas bacterium]|nr:hypothetical protein [Sphingomonas bacterium]